MTMHKGHNFGKGGRVVNTIKYNPHGTVRHPDRKAGVEECKVGALMTKAHDTMHGSMKKGGGTSK